MSKLLRRLLHFLRQRQRNADLAEEIEFHRSMKQKELESSGVPPTEARSASRAALGNVVIAREDARSVWIWPAFDQLARDARIGARMLVKSPLFTIFAVLVLSIGIGANVTVFSYLNAIFIRTLDVPEPDRLVRIYGDGEGPNGVISYEGYTRYRDGNQSFASIGMYFGASRIPLRIQGPRTLPVDIVQTTVANAALFEAIAVPPIAGRNFESADEQSGANKVVMLNESAWKKYFGGDPNIAGRRLFVDNAAYTIAGVVSPSFDRVFQIVPAATEPHVYLPADNPRWLLDANRNVMTSLIGRLKPAVSRSEAQADLSRLASQFSIEKKFGITVSVEPSNQPPSWLRVALASLLAFFLVGVFVVLLIACDDIAILLVARIAARQREMGIRLALGASRTQLLCQLLAENLMLAVFGGAGALIFALLSARVLERLPFSLPIPDSSRLTMDWRVLVFAAVLSLATTLLFGLRPALQCAWRDVVVSLNPGSVDSRTRFSKIRSNLIITQITVCTALLITAGVLVRSTRSTMSADRGFQAEQVLIGGINFTGSGYSLADQQELYERLLTRLNETPGILSASIAGSLPIALPAGDFFRFGGSFGRYVVRNDSNNADIQTSTNVVSPGYFNTLRIPLVQGRDFSEQDRTGSARTGIINESLAQRLWAGENPIGRTLRGEDATLIEVIGVVGNIRYQNEEQPAPLLYRPLTQTLPVRGLLPNTLMVRTSGEPMLSAPVVQARLAEIDPNLLVYNMHTLEERIGRGLLPFRIFAYVAGIPGAFALLLGVIGTYGTMALIVAQRRREIGIRIALGAHPSEAVSLMTREGLKWTSAGLCLGIFGAFLIVLWLSRQFYGLDFLDPVAFASMTLLVLATAGAACYIPARKASRLDPIKVLREE